MNTKWLDHNTFDIDQLHIPSHHLQNHIWRHLESDQTWTNFEHIQATRLCNYIITFDWKPWKIVTPFVPKHISFDPKFDLGNPIHCSKASTINFVKLFAKALFTTCYKDSKIKIHFLPPQTHASLPNFGSW